MFKSYLKIAFRNLLKHKAYSLINIFGLAIGLACCILILMYVGDELSYDSFHKNADRIFRVVLSYQKDGVKHWANTPAPLKIALQTEYPELRIITRVGGGGNQSVVIYKNKQIRNQRVQRVDADFLRIFSLPLNKGNKDTVFEDVNSVVISWKLAATLFENQDPMGRILRIGSISEQKDYQITGIMQKIPANSRFQIDAFTSFKENYAVGNEGNVSWGALNYSTYILFPNTFNKERLVRGSRNFWQKYRGKEIGGDMDLHLQALKEIHLNLIPGYALPTDRISSHIYIFLAIAFLILVIASINYMNLAIARYQERDKEVGMRKVLGANRQQLLKQFLGESILLSLISFIVSLLLVELFLPVFNQYVGKSMSFAAMANPFLLIFLTVLSIGVGLAAGSYPAFFTASLTPISILKGKQIIKRKHSGMGLKKTMVFFQFTISLIFIASTVIVHQQMDYIGNRELGYNSEHVLVIPIYQLGVRSRFHLFKSEILTQTRVVSATAANYLPSRKSYFQNVYFKEPDKDKLQYISWIPVDADFIETMGITLKQGRNFKKGALNEAGGVYILNESAVKKLDWRRPMEKRMKIINWGPVIGVVKDFHFKSLHYSIQPMALCVYPDAYEYLLVRIQDDETAATIRSLKEEWRKIFPNIPFTYTFFNDHFNQVYRSEIRLGNTFNLISGLAIIIACLGLFTLFSFTTGRRSKEIGIRKVLGCSTTGIVTMLTRELIYTMVMASLVAWPITLIIMNRWLQNFAFRTRIGISVFGLALLFCLILALATIGLQAIKRATANPVDTLRYE